MDLLVPKRPILVFGSFKRAFLYQGLRSIYAPSAFPSICSLFAPRLFLSRPPALFMTGSPSFSSLTAPGSLPVRGCLQHSPLVPQPPGSSVCSQTFSSLSTEEATLWLFFFEMATGVFMFYATLSVSGRATYLLCFRNRLPSPSGLLYDRVIVLSTQSLRSSPVTKRNISPPPPLL